MSPDLFARSHEFWFVVIPAESLSSRRRGREPGFLFQDGRARIYALSEKNKDVIFWQNEPEKLFRINTTP
jgi:hypothetical protein